MNTLQDVSTMLCCPSLLNVLHLCCIYILIDVKREEEFRAKNGITSYKFMNNNNCTSYGGALGWL